MKPIKEKGWRAFINRNLVTIVMIPGVILIHAGWSELQKNPAIASADEEKDSPVVVLAKHYWYKWRSVNATNDQKTDANNYSTK